MANFEIVLNGEPFSNLSSYSLDFEDIKNTTQAADGTVYASHVVTKATVTLKWQMIKDTELRRIADKLNVGSVNELIYYDYTVGGKRTSDFYVDNRSASIARIEEDNSIIWEEYTLKFIESGGQK